MSQAGVISDEPSPPVNRDWSEEAKGILKAEMKRRNLTYGNLMQLLADEGVQETEVNLRNKVSRGNFSAAFFLQCLSVMKCTNIQLFAEKPIQTYRFQLKRGPKPKQ